MSSDNGAVPTKRESPGFSRGECQLIGERPDAILNIVDGTNLERNLYLTTQLTELGIPVVVAINMIDLVNTKTIIIT